MPYSAVAVPLDLDMKSKIQINTRRRLKMQHLKCTLTFKERSCNFLDWDFVVYYGIYITDRADRRITILYSAYRLPATQYTTLYEWIVRNRILFSLFRFGIFYYFFHSQHSILICFRASAAPCYWPFLPYDFQTEVIHRFHQVQPPHRRFILQNLT